jgi:hypothetical protein
MPLSAWGDRASRSSTAGHQFSRDRPSLREPRYSKALHPLGTIFGPAKRRHDIAEIGKATLGIDLANACYDLLRLRKSLG